MNYKFTTSFIAVFLIWNRSCNSGWIFPTTTCCEAFWNHAGWDTLTLGIWKFRFFNRFVRDHFSFRGHVTLFHQHTRLHIRNNPHHSGNCSSQHSITQLFETHSLPPPPCCAPSSKISDFRVGIQVGSLPVHGCTKNSLRDIVMQKSWERLQQRRKEAETYVALRLPCREDSGREADCSAVYTSVTLIWICPHLNRKTEDYWFFMKSKAESINSLTGKLPFACVWVSEWTQCLSNHLPSSAWCRCPMWLSITKFCSRPGRTRRQLWNHHSGRHLSEHRPCPDWLSTHR